MNNLNILHWNISGFYNNNIDIIPLIRDHNVNVILLNETHLKTHQRPRITGFYNYRQDRLDGWGGIAVFVHQSINSRLIDISRIHLPDRWQALVIELDKCCIICTYIPPDVRFYSHYITELTSICPKPYFIIGDLNCQHQAWGSSWCNPNGNRLNQYIIEENLIILNSGEPTRITPPRTISVPDITLCSPSISLNCSWNVLADYGSSDHFPILISMSSQRRIPNQHCHEYRGFNVKKANWDTFTNFIYAKMSSNECQSYRSFHDIICEAASIAIPKKKIT